MGEQYPSNTDKSREERYVQNDSGNKIQAHVKKKGEFRKYIDYFFGDDYDSKPSFVDKVIPAINKAAHFLDLLNYIMEPTPRGNAAPIRVSRITQATREIGRAYNKISDARDYIPKRSPVFDFTDVRFDTIYDAQRAIDMLKEEQRMAVRHILPAAVLYDRLGLDVPNHIYWDQGWHDLSSVHPVRTISGDYIIALPQPEEITK